LGRTGSRRRRPGRFWKVPVSAKRQMINAQADEKIKKGTPKTLRHIRSKKTKVGRKKKKNITKAAGQVEIKRKRQEKKNERGFGWEQASRLHKRLENNV